MPLLVRVDSCFEKKSVENTIFLFWNYFPLFICILLKIKIYLFSLIGLTNPKKYFAVILSTYYIPINTIALYRNSDPAGLSDRNCDFVKDPASASGRIFLKFRIRPDRNLFYKHFKPAKGLIIKMVFILNFIFFI